MGPSLTPFVILSVAKNLEKILRLCLRMTTMICPRMVLRNLLVIFALLFGPGIAPAQDENLSFHVMRGGDTPLHGDLYALQQYLESHPEIRDEIEDRGRIRLILDRAKSRDRRYLAQLESGLHMLLDELGMSSRRIERQFIWVDWSRVREDIGYTFDQALHDDPGYLAALQRQEESVHETEPIATQLKKYFLALLARSTHTAKNTVIRIGQAFKGTRPVSEMAVTIPRCIGQCAQRIGHELIYLPKALWRSLNRPSRFDVVQGGLAKAPGVIGSLGSIAENYQAVNAPFHEGFHMSLGIGLATFHGIYVSTWLNYQDTLSKERGTRYQAIHNFVYGQLWPAVFIVNSWAAGLPNAIPNMHYIALSLSSALLDAPISAHGFQGLNRLYESGAISSATRSFIQLWVRDTIFTLQITELGLGRYGRFALLFLANQSVSGSLFLASKMVPQRPVLIITSDDLAHTESFGQALPHVFSKEIIEQNGLHGTLGSVLSLIKRTARKIKRTTCEKIFRR